MFNLDDSVAKGMDNDLIGMVGTWERVDALQETMIHEAV